MNNFRRFKNSITKCLSQSYMLKILKQVCLEFCSNSSIHGIRYIVEPGRKLLERVFWASLVMTSLLAAVLVAFRSDNLSMYYIRDYIKSIHYPTYMASQPAFTFCNANFQRSRVERLVNLMSLTQHYNRTALVEDLSSLQLLLSNNDVNVDELDFIKLERLQSILNDNSLSVEAAIRQVIQPCSELFVLCHFGSTLASCSKVIRSSKADSGFCCSINYIPPPDENKHRPEIEEVFQNKLNLMNYGFESGNSFLLNISVHDQLNPIYPAAGVEIYVHNRLQYPRLFSSGTFISNGWETFVRLTLIMRDGAPDIRFIEPHRRLCYFEDEVKLKYFHYYTYGNCISEARMDFIVRKCNCLPVTFPNQGQFKTCNLNDLKCVIAYQFSDMHGYNEDVYIRLNGKKFTCYNTCSQTQFSLSTSYVLFDIPQMNANKYFDGINTTGLTLVHLFKDSPSVLLYYREPASYFWDMVVI